AATIDELLRRSERFDVAPGGAQHHRQRVADGFVVVDNENGRFAIHGAPVGSEKWKAVPPPGRLSCHSRPPCISRTERQIDKPSPNPRSLVVKNGVNRRGSCSGAMPAPRSATVTHTALRGSAAVWMRSSRCAGGVLRIASTALLTRLRSTCSTRMASACVLGSEGSSANVRRT